MNRIAIAAASLAFTLPLVPFEALAQNANTHGCACLHNRTGQQINYRYKWGEAEWQTRALQPGYRSWMCWRYADNSRSSPQLLFQLDVDMSSGTAWTTYNITRVQSPAAHCDSIPSNGHFDVSYRPGTNNAFIHVTRRQ
ncbi:MAG: hypothetical protein FJX02_12945 [Alphaproteobacteria bacterium]|nr:hypothetical protein [Alphaproteobacteria bacterium]